MKLPHLTPEEIRAAPPGRDAPLEEQLAHPASFASRFAKGMLAVIGEPPSALRKLADQHSGPLIGGGERTVAVRFDPVTRQATAEAEGITFTAAL